MTAPHPFRNEFVELAALVYPQFRIDAAAGLAVGLYSKQVAGKSIDETAVSLELHAGANRLEAGDGAEVVLRDFDRAEVHLADRPPARCADDEPQDNEAGDGGAARREQKPEAGAADPDADPVGQAERPAAAGWVLGVPGSLQRLRGEDHAAGDEELQRAELRAGQTAGGWAEPQVLRWRHDALPAAGEDGAHAVQDVCERRVGPRGRRYRAEGAAHEAAVRRLRPTGDSV